MEQISTPVRAMNSSSKAGAVVSTPSEASRRYNLSFSAPTEKHRKVEGNNTTFIMSNSSGKTKTNSRRFETTIGSLMFDDEESVLVASPFAYVTPPMPPRDEVSNTKTTRAMAKIVEEVGTPDSVIRKLSFVHQCGSSTNSSLDDFPAPGTVNRVGRAMSEQEEDSFRFPIVTPSQEMSRVELDPESPSEGFSRFSLSMMDLYPPQSPKPVRPGVSCLGEPSAVPDLLTNCETCGKQFISAKHVEEHAIFCRPDVRSDTMCSSMTASHKSGEGMKKTKYFIESPALPLYVQRAQAAASLPAVAPLPLPPSPSILASPAEEDFIEEEISTFLECLRSDVRNKVEDIEREEKRNRQVLQPMSSGSSSSEGSCSVAITDRQREWASRRAKKALGSSHSLCVSSDEDSCIKVEEKTKLVFAPMQSSPPPPLPPPVPMSSNVSVNSPIPQRASFDMEASISTSFLTGPAPSPVVAKYISPPTGRASPTFGFRSSTTSLLTDSAVTLMRLSRIPCGCCGRQFASAARLEKHETVCRQVFGKKTRSPKSLPPPSSVEPILVEPSATATPLVISCRYCGRSFSHADKLARHEHICLSVFKGRKRSKSPTARTQSFSDESNRMSLTSCETVTVMQKPKLSFNRNLKVHAFTAAVVLPLSSFIKRTNLVTVGTQYEEPLTQPAGLSRSRSVTIDNSSVMASSCSNSSVNRTSLEFQYQLLREQIRSCSEKLKQRRVYAIVRDA